MEEGGRLPLFSSLEEREDPLQGEPWRHVRDGETRHLPTASHLGVRPPSSSSQDSPLPLLAALCVAAELELLNQLPAKRKNIICFKEGRKKYLPLLSGLILLPEPLASAETGSPPPPVVVPVVVADPQAPRLAPPPGV